MIQHSTTERGAYSPGSHSLALPPGTLVGQYRILHVLGQPGGFGITYLAEDVTLETRVAIKEFLPRDLAGRGTDHASVVPHSSQDGDHFRTGLEQFMGEARRLARIRHRNVVGVRAFIEANGTAYLVMEYYEGETLAEYLARKGGPMPPAVAVEVILRLMDGLAAAHAQNIMHRDVKPENIYLTVEGYPVLLDFGAARQAIGGNRHMTRIYTPGYAPYEQYSSTGEQGPWTDVYACAGVLYQCLTGKRPVEAIERMRNDPLLPPSRLAGGIPRALDAAVMAGLAMDVEARPKSVAEFQQLLEAGLDAPQQPATPGRPTGGAAAGAPSSPRSPGDRASATGGARTAEPARVAPRKAEPPKSEPLKSEPPKADARAADVRKPAAQAAEAAKAIAPAGERERPKPFRHLAGETTREKPEARRSRTGWWLTAAGAAAALGLLAYLAYGRSATASTDPAQQDSIALPAVQRAAIPAPSRPGGSTPGRMGVRTQRTNADTPTAALTETASAPPGQTDAPAAVAEPAPALAEISVSVDASAPAVAPQSTTLGADQLGGFRPGDASGKPAGGTPDNAARSAGVVRGVEERRAVLVHRAEPVLPAELRSFGAAPHSVHVRFTVDASGRVDRNSIMILRTSNALLNREVGRVLPYWRYEPARSGGEPVPETVEVKFEFTAPR